MKKNHGENDFNLNEFNLNFKIRFEKYGVKIFLKEKMSNEKRQFFLDTFLDLLCKISKMDAK